MYEPDRAWAMYPEEGAVGIGYRQQARFSVWAVRKTADNSGGWL